MKVNYILMYAIPYVRYKEFEKFEDISKFLVHKRYVNYSIFKKLEDKEEIEMIYRDNDIHYLENFVKEQDKEIEKLKLCNSDYYNMINTLSSKLSRIRERASYEETNAESLSYDILKIIDDKNIILGSDKE